MVAGGIPKPRKYHVQYVVEMALDIQPEIINFKGKGEMITYLLAGRKE